MASFAGVFVEALRDALRADADVAAIVGGKVFDVVPGLQGVPGSTVTPPWIYMGPLSAPRFEDACYRAWQPRIRLFCASDSFNRDQAWAMVDAVDAALDRRTLALPDPFAMQGPLAALDVGDLIDPTKPRVAFCDFQCVIYRTAPFAPDQT